MFFDVLNKEGRSANNQLIVLHKPTVHEKKPHHAHKHHTHTHMSCIYVTNTMLKTYEKYDSSLIVNRSQRYYCLE